MRWLGHVSHIAGNRHVKRVLVREHEGNSPLQGPRHRQNDGIKTDEHAIKLT